MKCGEIEIRGPQAHPFSFRDVIAGIAAGRIPASRLITHRIPLGQVGDAFRLLEARDERVQKIVLLPDVATPMEEAHT